MINYTSQFQTKIEEFSNINSIKAQKLTTDGYYLVQLLPWDDMVNIYKKKFSGNMGAKTINPRQVIGAFIIKHKLDLTDEETLIIISENPYMQFFLGLEKLQS